MGGHLLTMVMGNPSNWVLIVLWLSNSHLLGICSQWGIVVTGNCTLEAVSHYDDKWLCNVDISPLWWLVTTHYRYHLIVMISDCTLKDILLVMSYWAVVDIFIVISDCTVVDNFSLWWSVTAHWRTSSHCGDWWLHTGGYLLTVMTNNWTMEDIFLQMTKTIHSLSWSPSHEMLLKNATFKRDITISSAIFNTNLFPHDITQAWGRGFLMIANVC